MKKKNQPLYSLLRQIDSHIHKHAIRYDCQDKIIIIIAISSQDLHIGYSNVKLIGSINSPLLLFASNIFQRPFSHFDYIKILYIGT